MVLVMFGWELKTYEKAIVYGAMKEKKKKKLEVGSWVGKCVFFCGCCDLTNHGFMENILANGYGSLEEEASVFYDWICQPNTNISSGSNKLLKF